MGERVRLLFSPSSASCCLAGEYSRRVRLQKGYLHALLFDSRSERGVEVTSDELRAAPAAERRTAAVLGCSRAFARGDTTLS